MRKIISSLMITLDGIVESPGTWQYGLFDNDMMGHMKAQIENEDTILLGRNTYLEWYKGWPYSKDKPYGAHINSIPKYVFSKTLDKVTWGDFDNISLIRNDFERRITELKQSEDKNIGIGGSPGLV